MNWGYYDSGNTGNRINTEDMGGSSDETTF